MSPVLSPLNRLAGKAKALQVGQEGAVVRLHAETNIDLTFGRCALAKLYYLQV